MKICPKCGKQCGDNYLFCDSCGCKLEPENAAEQADNGVSAANLSQNDQNQTRFTNSDENQTTSFSAASSEKPNDANASFNTASQQQQYTSNFGTQPQNQYSSPNPGQFQGNYNTYTQNQAQKPYTKPNPYPQNAWQSNFVEPKNNPYAIASFVLGLVGIVFMCVYLIGVIPSILAIIFGCIGRSKIKASGGGEKGLGFTTAGITLGIVALVLMVLIIILTAVGIITLSAIGSNYYKFSDIDDLCIHNLRLFKF